MTDIEKAIRDIVLQEVARAEQRILESLSASPDRTLTFTEACEYLQMSEYTLRNLIRSKGIPHRVYGYEGSKNPRYLFSSRRLDQWIQEQEEMNYKAGRYSERK